MKPRKPIRHTSTARSRQLREYKKVKAEFLSVNDKCFSCGWKRHISDRELHHFYGRIGRLLCWKPGFRLVCSTCHKAIHEQPKWAIEEGLLAPMGTFNDYNRAKAHYESNL